MPAILSVAIPSLDKVVIPRFPVRDPLNVRFPVTFRLFVTVKLLLTVKLLSTVTSLPVISISPAEAIINFCRDEVYGTV